MVIIQATLPFYIVYWCKEFIKKEKLNHEKKIESKNNNQSV
jgi:hypothetical protein